MKKTTKIIVSLVLVLAFALCVLTACNKDKTETKAIDATEALTILAGGNGGDGVVALLGKTDNVKVDFKTNFDGVEESGFSIVTQDGGSEYESTDASILHIKKVANGVETENYVGYNFKVIKGEVKKLGDIYNLVKITENGVEEKQVEKIEAAKYNEFCKDNIVYYISTLCTRVFNKYGEIIDTVVCSGARTYKNGKLESTTITTTYEDVENNIQGKITFVLSQDEKQITKATVEQNGVVVFEGTYTYNVPTIIMPSISGTTWEERPSYEVA